MSKSIFVKKRWSSSAKFVWTFNFAWLGNEREENGGESFSFFARYGIEQNGTC